MQPQRHGMVMQLSEQSEGVVRFSFRERHGRALSRGFGLVDRHGYIGTDGWLFKLGVLLAGDLVSVSSRLVDLFHTIWFLVYISERRRRLCSWLKQRTAIGRLTQILHDLDG